MSESMAMAAHKVFVLDDHPVFREGLAAVVGRHSKIIISGQAGGSEDAMKAIDLEKPDLVVVEIALPGKDGIEFIKELHARHPDLPILAISMHDDLLYGERVLAAGGRGYIMKHEAPEVILEGICKVLEGEIFVSARVASSIVQGASRRRSHSLEITRLTEREFSVFQLIGQGKSCREIAHELALSVKTVSTHRGHIKRKLSLESSAQLIHCAVRHAKA